MDVDLQISRAEIYVERFGACPRQIAAPPDPALWLTVVIPCHDEPDLSGTLEALQACTLPDCAVEIIVVINAAATASEAVRARNAQTFKEARDWAIRYGEPRLRCHVLHFPDLPANRAGVGLARKIGMDEAALRLDEVGALEGVIACLDADCGCDANYLTALVEHFRRQRSTPGCSVYFEHPIDEAGGGSETQVAIALYELHLRYYVQALRYARYPFAYHTVGSAMAVRADAYLRQGGMNKRRAGEDFYFLHKIMPLGGYTDLLSTRVIPSPRVSHRVPFGTGRAMRDFLEAGERSTYPLQAFLDLKNWLETVDQLHATAEGLEQTQARCSPAMQNFLVESKFEPALVEMRGNAASLEAFQKRFFGWLDGFTVLKWVHYARDRHYGRGKLSLEPVKLLERIDATPPGPSDRGLTELLRRYRRLDREGCGPLY